MIETYVKKFLGTPFLISASKIENTPGTWNSTKISIYRDELLIGEYIRNYDNYGPLTFYPFLIDDEWYALYSADYTCTRVMKLCESSIEDWCGETANSSGFCPVEFYIPRYNTYTSKHMFNDKETISIYHTTDSEYKTDQEFIDDQSNENFIKESFCNFGFLCGCVWGDDTSWKLRYIDLSKIPEKILSITEKFGYWELPSSMTLRQCINMGNWAPDFQIIELSRSENVNLETGERY